jgi:DNA-binding LytR/AlgR family response regulator
LTSAAKNSKQETRTFQNTPFGVLNPYLKTTSFDTDSIPKSIFSISLKIITTMVSQKIPPPHEILFLRGDINYTEFHLVNGKKYLSSNTLLRHQEKLEGFLRVSRKHLINPNYISYIESRQGLHQILMVNGERILVSRRRKSSII